MFINLQSYNIVIRLKMRTTTYLKSLQSIIILNKVYKIYARSVLFRYMYKVYQNNVQSELDLFTKFIKFMQKV